MMNLMNRNEYHWLPYTPILGRSIYAFVFFSNTLLVLPFVYLFICFTQFSRIPTPCFCRPLPYGTPLSRFRKGWTCFREVMWGIPVNLAALQSASWCLNENTNHCIYTAFCVYGPLTLPSLRPGMRTIGDLLAFRVLWHFYRALLCFVCFPFSHWTCISPGIPPGVCPRTHLFLRTHSLSICTTACVCGQCTIAEGKD